MRRTRAALVAFVGFAALAAVGCAAETEATPQPSAGATTRPTPTAPPQPTSSEAPGADEPTCDTIIPASTVASFRELGWQPLQEPFQLSSLVLEGGLLCKWGDPTIPSDHVQIYGWAPISEAETGNAQLELVNGGWLREDAPEGVYITESDDTAIDTDDDGYGWTYLFGDGWVKFADTKQGLLLVEWPAP